MKDKQIVVRLPAKLHEVLLKRAEEEERRPSQLVRFALREYLGVTREGDAA